MRVDWCVSSWFSHQEYSLTHTLSRGSRGGYPLAALGSEDWCDAIHAGVFSGGRPSVHGVAPSPTAPASTSFAGVTPCVKPET